ncbi:MAG: glycosyltransferase [Lachnospiraceae bacterium]|nr:glycosyltransferase [Lachnospiraceae bacterium]
MRILHLISGLGQGGAEKLLLSVCKEHKVLGNIQKVVYFLDEHDLLPYFRKEGIDVISLAPKRGVMKSLFIVRRIIKQFNPDIIHTHLVRADSIGRAAGLFSSHGKIISTIHNCDEWKRKKTINSLLLRFFNCVTVNLCGRVSLIAVSESVKRFCMITEKIRADKIIILHNFAGNISANDGEVITRNRIGVPDNAFLFVNVGRLTDQKNQLEILRAAKVFRNRNVYFLILGEGELRAKFETLIADKELANVVLEGYVENVSDYLKIADMMLLTSKYEGQPLTVLEAAKCKLPVLASNIEAIRDLDDNGLRVTMYEEGNRQALVKVIEAVLSGSIDYQALANDAYHYSLAHTAAHYTKQLTEIYGGENVTQKNIIQK